MQRKEKILERNLATRPGKKVTFSCVPRTASVWSSRIRIDKFCLPHASAKLNSCHSPTCTPLRTFLAFCLLSLSDTQGCSAHLTWGPDNEIFIPTNLLSQRKKMVLMKCTRSWQKIPLGSRDLDAKKTWVPEDLDSPAGVERRPSTLAHTLQPAGQELLQFLHTALQLRRPLLAVQQAHSWKQRQHEICVWQVSNKGDCVPTWTVQRNSYFLTKVLRAPCLWLQTSSVVGQAKSITRISEHPAWANLIQNTSSFQVKPCPVSFRYLLGRPFLFDPNVKGYEAQSRALIWMSALSLFFEISQAILVFLVGKTDAIQLNICAVMSTK